MELHAVPYYSDELRHGELLGHEELGLVEHGQSGLLGVALHDHRYFGRELRPYVRHLLLPGHWCFDFEFPHLASHTHTTLRLASV